jgi:predicted RNase H-like HicB family nuclease
MAPVTDKTYHYHVVITHENGAWLADVPELAGAHTFARNIPGLHTAIREVIALVEDLPAGAENELDLDYEYRIGIPEVEAETRQLRADRKRIRQEEDELARRTDAAARTLVERYKFSVRDAAALTGVSKQRISQLVPRKEAAERLAKQTTRKKSPPRVAKPGAATSRPNTGRSASADGTGR